MSGEWSYKANSNPFLGCEKVGLQEEEAGFVDVEVAEGKVLVVWMFFRRKTDDDGCVAVRRGRCARQPYVTPGRPSPRRLFTCLPFRDRFSHLTFTHH